MIAAHWPERLYRAFVINMPGFFSILWKLIEPLMAQSTRKKIRLLRGKAVSCLALRLGKSFSVCSIYHSTPELADNAFVGQNVLTFSLGSLDLLIHLMCMSV